MAATIQFPNGMTATLRGNHWHCANEDLNELLALTTESLPPGYRPTPEADLAREVAARLGAELISSEHVSSDAPPDALF